LPRSTAMLPVQRRRTLRADGSIVEVLLVFCAVKERSVAAGRCNDCDRSQIVVLGRNEVPRFVLCDGAPAIAEADPGCAASPHATPVWGAMSGTSLCVEPEVSAGNLAKVLADASIDCTPVVDEEGLLLGIVGRPDLMRWQWHDGAPAVSVQSLMRRAPRILAVTRVATAGALMASEGIEAVAVVSSEQRPMVLGVITARDVMGWLAHPPGHPREGRLPGADA
jgi:CBS domain-containing protein